MYCINCGHEINEGEAICKGCGKLSKSIREELLALSEKTADFQCEKCGANVKEAHHYCHECGSTVS